MELIERIPGDKGPIGKRTVKDQISDKIAYMIHSGLLQPGDELPSERDLAATLGVSRETVRSAIGVLQARHMVEVSQGARTRVLGTGPFQLHESVSTLGDLKNRSFEEVAEARAAVEVQVVWLATQRISAAQIKRLEDLVSDQQGMISDPVRFQISDQEFHTTLYRACGNGLLADVVSDFYAYALEYRRRALQKKGAIANSVREHRAIVDALKAGQPELAVKAMQGHLEQVRQTTLTEMGNFHG
ncbi:MAG: FadR/GntR family transcriptional regulator [Rhodoferax sp.]